MRFFWITCFILCILFPFLSLGQTIGIRGYMDADARGLVGHVLSDKGGGVPYAHVFFMHGKDTIPLVCDAIGSFSWSVSRVPDTLQVRVTAVGYKTLDVSYSPKNQGNRLYIRIQQAAIELNEVIVTAKKVYMVVKGDTLEYKADAFKTLDGDFIGNLLQKLPGVSYEDGSLTVNGQSIYRIYVNGEDFGTKHAVLSNLRADNVKDIQVYDERNKEEQEAGMKYGRPETVMNVVTKQKVERWTKDWRNGSFLFGTGFDVSNNPTSRFKQKWNLKFDYAVPMRKNDSKSNIGKSLTLAGEYKNIGTTIDIQNSRFSLNYKNRNQDFVKAGLKNKRLFYSTQNTFINSKQYTRELDERIYIPTSDYESRTYHGYKNGKNNMWEFNSIHTFAYKQINCYFEFMSGEKKEDRSNRERSETNDSLTSFVNMQYHKKDLYSSGKVNLSFYLTEGVRFRTSFDLGQGTITSRQIDTLLETNRRLYLEQEYDQQDASWETSINYGKTLSLYSYGFNYKYQSSMDKEDGESVNKLTSLLDTNGTRDYTYYQQHHSLGGHVTISTQKNYLRAGMSVHRLFRNRVERFPYREKFQDDFLYFESNLSIQKKYSPTFNWNMAYSLSSQLPELSQTRREIETSNPLFLRAGNPNLKPEKKHILDVKFNRLFVSSATHLAGKVSYTLTHDFIATSESYFQKLTYLPEYDYTVNAGATFSTPKNTKTSHELLVDMRYSTYSGLLKSKLEITGIYRYVMNPFLTQEVVNNQKSNWGAFRIYLTTAFSRKVEFNLFSYTSVTNTQSDLDRASNILVQNSSLSFRTSLIPKCSLSTKFSYNYSKNYATEGENGRSNLEFEIEPKLWRFASLKLEGKNLLNRQSGVTFSKNTIYTSRIEKAQTGRYVMLTFTQKLR